MGKPSAVVAGDATTPLPSARGNQSHSHSHSHASIASDIPSSSASASREIFHGLFKDLGKQAMAMESILRLVCGKVDTLEHWLTEVSFGMTELDQKLRNIAHNIEGTAANVDDAADVARWAVPVEQDPLQTKAATPTVVKKVGVGLNKKKQMRMTGMVANILDQLTSVAEAETPTATTPSSKAAESETDDGGGGGAGRRKKKSRKPRDEKDQSASETEVVKEKSHKSHKKKTIEPSQPPRGSETQAETKVLERMQNGVVVVDVEVKVKVKEMETETRTVDEVIESKQEKQEETEVEEKETEMAENIATEKKIAVEEIHASDQGVTEPTPPDERTVESPAPIADQPQEVREEPGVPVAESSHDVEEDTQAHVAHEPTQAGRPDAASVTEPEQTKTTVAAAIACTAPSKLVPHLVAIDSAIHEAELPNETSIDSQEPIETQRVRSPMVPGSPEPPAEETSALSVSPASPITIQRIEEPAGLPAAVVVSEPMPSIPVRVERPTEEPRLPSEEQQPPPSRLQHPTLSPRDQVQESMENVATTLVPPVVESRQASASLPKFLSKAAQAKPSADAMVMETPAAKPSNRKLSTTQQLSPQRKPSLRKRRPQQQQQQLQQLQAQTLAPAITPLVETPEPHIGHESTPTVVSLGPTAEKSRAKPQEPSEDDDVDDGSSDIDDKGEDEEVEEEDDDDSPLSSDSDGSVLDLGGNENDPDAAAATQAGKKMSAKLTRTLTALNKLQKANVLSPEEIVELKQRANQKWFRLRDHVKDKAKKDMTNILLKRKKNIFTVSNRIELLEEKSREVYASIKQLNTDLKYKIDATTLDGLRRHVHDLHASLQVLDQTISQSNTPTMDHIKQLAKDTETLRGLVLDQVASARNHCGANHQETLALFESEWQRVVAIDLNLQEKLTILANGFDAKLLALPDYADALDGIRRAIRKKADLKVLRELEARLLGHDAGGDDCLIRCLSCHKEVVNGDNGNDGGAERDNDVAVANSPHFKRVNPGTSSAKVYRSNVPLSAQPLGISESAPELFGLTSPEDAAATTPDAKPVTPSRRASRIEQPKPSPLSFIHVTATRAMAAATAMTDANRPISAPAIALKKKTPPKND